MRSLSLGSLALGSLAFVVGLVGALPALAQAQAPQGTPTRIRGTVEKLDGQVLIVKSREGQVVTIDLAPNYGVRGLVRKSLSDIKAGDYVASTGRKGSDGKLHAVEVRIFPEALRGAGEGQFPWDLTPDSMMTNATGQRHQQRAPRRDPDRDLQGPQSDTKCRPIPRSWPTRRPMRARSSPASRSSSWRSSNRTARSPRPTSPSRPTASSRRCDRRREARKKSQDNFRAFPLNARRHRLRLLMAQPAGGCLSSMTPPDNTAQRLNACPAV